MQPFIFKSELNIRVNVNCENNDKKYIKRATKYLDPNKSEVKMY